MAMNLNHHSSFPPVILALVLLFFTAATATAVSGGDLCESTDYKPLCRATIKGIKEPKAATEAAIKYALLITKHALYLSRRIKQSDTNDICKQNYDDAISDLEESLQNLKDDDKGTLNTNLSAAISYYSTCEDAYEEMGEKSPLSKVNSVLESMVSNCLVLVTLIH